MIHVSIVHDSGHKALAKNQVWYTKSQSVKANKSKGAQQTAKCMSTSHKNQINLSNRKKIAGTY